MRVLIVGNGAREHALAWKISQSPLVSAIYGTCPNAGMRSIVIDTGLNPMDVHGIVRFAVGADLGLVVVGPEGPIVAGISDQLRSVGVSVFGPSRAAARLESSKWFGKMCMRLAGVPTPRAKLVRGYDAAVEAVRNASYPLVVKADGLASGKGAYVCNGYSDAIFALQQLMQEQIVGDAGNAVLIEDAVLGNELSLFALVSGDSVLPFGACVDYKRLRDGDIGPNTGGMGAVSPAPNVTEQQIALWTRELISPVVRYLFLQGVEYYGVLYAGVMLTNNGPMVLEYNVRLGDPETQAMMPRCGSDLIPLLLAASCGSEVHNLVVNWCDSVAVSVVAATDGYPGNLRLGEPISGFDDIKDDPDIFAFHAGTRLQDTEDGKMRHDMCVSGGRVVTITALAQGVDEARERAYRSMDRIRFAGKHVRTDIGKQIRK